MYVDPSEPCCLAIENTDISFEGKLFLAADLEEAVALL
jgi:hypothetical protein